MSLIDVEHLSKVYRRVKPRPGARGALLDLFHRHYEEVRAVDDVSFAIQKGELVGYIGPNGAGKSTTIKMLTGILIPSSGTIKVGDYVPYRDRHRYTRHIGVVFGQRTQLWWDIPVVESFRLLQKVYQIPKDEFERRLGHLRELLELDPLMTTPARKLSLGQRMRCDLVTSILHGPRLLFLDEPTIGLDLIAKQRIREFLKQINREQELTMILTTHDLKEIEELCARLMVIDRGKILYDGELARLRKQYQFDRHLILQVEGVVNLEELQRQTAFNGSVHWQKLEDARLQLSFKNETYNFAFLIERILKFCPVHDITIDEPSIEDIVGRIYSTKS